MGKAARTRRARRTPVVAGAVLDRRLPVAGHCTYPSTVTPRRDTPQGWSGMNEPLWVVEVQHLDNGKTRVGWAYSPPPAGTIFDQEGQPA